MKLAWGIERKADGSYQLVEYQIPARAVGKAIGSASSYDAAVGRFHEAAYEKVLFAKKGPK